MIKKVLTIAGSDCSGGAGIQADIKTITAHKMYAMSVITALTAQNTTGVYGIIETPPEFVASQLDCVFQDIRPDAVKIGMISNAEAIEVIVEKLKSYGACNIVIDPVMVSTSGCKLINNEAIDTLIKKLLPLGTVITPNMNEASVLSSTKVETKEDMEKAAGLISKYTHGAILVKGGHLLDCADDYLYHINTALWIDGERVDNDNLHGTGCTLSSAIACGLADDLSVLESVKRAKAYLTGALKVKSFNLGKGSGPLWHGYAI